MHIAIGYRWFLTSAGYYLERTLRDLGHDITFIGLPYGQRSGYDTTVSVHDIFQALPSQPDFYLWVDPAGRYFPPGIEDLPVPTAAYLIDVHLGTWRQQAARFFDVLFVAQKDYLEPFRRVVGHDQITWLPPAALPGIHEQLDLPRIYDVGFVGNVSLAHRRTARVRRLRQIAERFRTNELFRFYSPNEVAQVYSQSRLVFNTSIRGDVTMRVFEGTACGALVLTDSTANGLADLFDIGREIIVYQDDADLLDKIAYYLAHEDERAEIARAGHQRTQADHTLINRSQTIVDIMGAPSLQRAAPMRRASSQERRAARREVYTHLHMLDAILDDAREAGANPLQRVWAVAPCLLRRLLT